MAPWIVISGQIIAGLILGGWALLVVSFGKEFALGVVAGALLYAVMHRVDYGRWP